MMKRVFKAIVLILVGVIAFIGLKLIFVADEERSMINDMKAYVAYMYEGVRHSLDSTYTMDYSRVHHYIDRAIDLSPSRENAYYSKALYYNMEDGDDNRAVGIYKMMCDKGIDFPYCAYMAGEAYDRLEVKDSAMYFYREAYNSYNSYLDAMGVDTSSFDYSKAVDMKKYLEEKLMVRDADTMVVK